MSADLEARIIKAVDALARKKVLVGVPSDAKQPPTGKDEPPPLWVIAYQNEFGDDERNIPPRSFLISGIEDARKEIVEQLMQGARKAFHGDLSAPDKAMHAAGLAAQSAIKAKLLAGPFRPLKPTTIKARARRKDEDSKLVNAFGPRGARRYLKLQREGVPDEVLNEVDLARPLYDTGALYNAITFAVKG